MGELGRYLLPRKLQPLVLIILQLRGTDDRRDQERVVAVKIETVDDPAFVEVWILEAAAAVHRSGPADFDSPPVRGPEFTRVGTCISSLFHTRRSAAGYEENSD